MLDAKISPQRRLYSHSKRNPRDQWAWPLHEFRRYPDLTKTESRCSPATFDRTDPAAGRQDGGRMDSVLCTYPGRH